MCGDSEQPRVQPGHLCPRHRQGPLRQGVSPRLQAGVDSALPSALPSSVALSHTMREPGASRGRGERKVTKAGEAARNRVTGTTPCRRSSDPSLATSPKAGPAGPSSPSLYRQVIPGVLAPVSHLQLPRLPPAIISVLLIDVASDNPAGLAGE